MQQFTLQMDKGLSEQMQFSSPSPAPRPNYVANGYPPGFLSASFGHRLWFGAGGDNSSRWLLAQAIQ